MIRHLACLALSTLFVGCSSSGPAEPELLLAQLAAQEELWLANRPEGSYRMVQQRACECLLQMSGPVRMAVGRQESVQPSSNEVVSWVFYVGTGLPVPDEYRSLFLTVQALFAFARESLEAGAEVVLRVDAELGYPTFLAVDPDPDAADDEVTYTITEMVIG